MKNKDCFKCGESKPLSEFYKHKQMKDGHLNKCITCNKKDAMAHRSENLEKIREYDRERGCRQSPEYTMTTTITRLMLGGYAKRIISSGMQRTAKVRTRINLRGDT
jgi:hypothetical protein